MTHSAARRFFSWSVLLSALAALIILLGIQSALREKTDSGEQGKTMVVRPKQNSQQADRTAVEHVATTSPETETRDAPLFETGYIEVTSGCAYNFEGGCVNVRSGPGTEYGVVAKLRTGVVLKTGSTTKDEDGRTWYQIIFDEWIRYPDRLLGSWYVASDFVTPLSIPISSHKGTTTKQIVIDLGDQTLTAYEGTESIFYEAISSGKDGTPTPRGEFSIFRKTPSRYMQGPIPYISNKIFDLPGVPWALYFTEEGAAIHGAYWHNAFGEEYSNGCINLPPEKARALYEWAEVGTEVVVKD